MIGAYRRFIWLESIGLLKRRKYITTREHLA